MLVLSTDHLFTHLQFAAGTSCQFVHWDFCFIIKPLILLLGNHFYCPLCLLPGIHIPTPFDGARRFSFAGGLVDHV